MEDKKLPLSEGESRPDHERNITELRRKTANMSFDQVLSVVMEVSEYIFFNNQALRDLITLTGGDAETVILELSRMTEEEFRRAIRDNEHEDRFMSDVRGGCEGMLTQFEAALPRILPVDPGQLSEMAARIGVVVALPEDVMDSLEAVQKIELLQWLTALEASGTEVGSLIGLMDPEVRDDPWRRIRTLDIFSRLNEQGRRNYSLCASFVHLRGFGKAEESERLNNLHPEFLEGLRHMRESGQISPWKSLTLSEVVKLQEMFSVQGLDALMEVFDGTGICLNLSDPDQYRGLLGFSENARRVTNVILKERPLFSWTEIADDLNALPQMNADQLRGVGVSLDENPGDRKESSVGSIMDNIRHSLSLTARGIDTLAVIRSKRYFPWHEWADEINSVQREKLSILETLLGMYTMNLPVQDVLAGVNGITDDSMETALFIENISGRNFVADYLFSLCQRLSRTIEDADRFRSVAEALIAESGAGDLEDVLQWTIFTQSGTEKFRQLYESGMVPRYSIVEELYRKIASRILDPVSDYAGMHGTLGSQLGGLWGNVAEFTDLGIRNAHDLEGLVFEIRSAFDVDILNGLSLGEVEHVQTYCHGRGGRIRIASIPTLLQLEQGVLSGLDEISTLLGLNFLEYEKVDRLRILTTGDARELLALVKKGNIETWNDVILVHDHIDTIHRISDSAERIDLESFIRMKEEIERIGLSKGSVFVNQLFSRIGEDVFSEYFLERINNHDVRKETVEYLFASYVGVRCVGVSSRGVTPASLTAWRMLDEFSARGNQDGTYGPAEIAKLLTDTKKSVQRRIERIENRKLPDIPEGLRVSIGTELEIMMNGLARTGTVSTEEIIDYERTARQKDDPRLTGFIEKFRSDVEPRIASAKTQYRSGVALATQLGVGMGRDGTHEFANVATDDYQYLLWEFSELGKLGFIDFDRKFIQWVEKGMHLTISGDGTGIRLDEDAELLQTALLSTGWSTSMIDAVGALEIVDEVEADSEKLYNQSKGFILQRGFLRDKVFGKKSASVGVENRAIRLNSFEHLAKTLRSFHRLGIALKAYQKNPLLAKQLETGYVRKKIQQYSKQDGDVFAAMAEDHELNTLLEQSGVADVRERELMLVWATFREGTVENFEDRQLEHEGYQLKSPLEHYDNRDMTRLGAELISVFKSHDDTGMLDDDALRSYHQKATPESLPDAERELVIRARSAVERILRKEIV